MQLGVVAALYNLGISLRQFGLQTVQTGKDFDEEGPTEIVLFKDVHDARDTVVLGTDFPEDRALRVHGFVTWIFPRTSQRTFGVDGQEYLDHVHTFWNHACCPMKCFPAIARLRFADMLDISNCDSNGFYDYPNIPALVPANENGSCPRMRFLSPAIFHAQ